MPRPPKKQPIKYSWFDPWLAAKGEPLRTLVEEVTAIVVRHESDTGVRKRSRKEVDLAHFQTAVEVSVANLAYAVLVPPLNGRLAVDASHRLKGMTRYDNRALGKAFRPLLDILETLGMHERRYSLIRGEKSSIAPTEHFATMVRDRGISLHDFAQLQSKEVICLTRKAGRGDDAVRQFVDYQDTEETIALRADMRAINTYISSMAIRYVGNDEPPDLSKRILSRRYILLKDQTAPRFDQSGRLFGGFWQHLERERRANLRLNDAPVVELDYGSMFTRLAYARMRLQPPTGDLYRIPGLEKHRDGVKLAMNIFLFDNRRRNKWPEDKTSGLLPSEWSVGRTKDAILKVHPILKEVWGKAVGYQLMWQESEVLVAVLKTLFSEDIPALPIHDALIVPVSAAERTGIVMEETAQRLTGISIPVAMK